MTNPYKPPIVQNKRPARFRFDRRLVLICGWAFFSVFGTAFVVPLTRTPTILGHTLGLVCFLTGGVWRLTFPVYQKLLAVTALVAGALLLLALLWFYPLPFRGGPLCAYVVLNAALGTLVYSDAGVGNHQRNEMILLTISYVGGAFIAPLACFVFAVIGILFSRRRKVKKQPKFEDSQVQENENIE